MNLNQATSVTPAEQRVELGLLAAGMDALLPLLQISRLLEGYAEGLGAHARRSGVEVSVAFA